MKEFSYHHRGGAEPLLGAPIYSYLASVAQRFADREALVSVEQGVRLTYAELFKESDRLARALLALGLGRGDRVGIWATDNVEWVLLQIATARLGIVLVNINPAYRTAELEHALKAARIQALILMPAFRRSHYADMVRGLCPQSEQLSPRHFLSNKLPELRHLVVYEPSDPDHTEKPASAFWTWQEFLREGERITDDQLAQGSVGLEMDDPINIQFTSGTTGFPKPVVLTHHNILNNAYFGARAMAFTEKDRLCVPVPFYHCFGMVLSNLACLTHGATIVIPSSHFDPRAVLQAVQDERCTALHGVPTMFVAEFGLDDFSSFDLSSLRTGIMAGAPCPPDLMERVIGEMGCREILIAYGQTEASPVTHITQRDDSFERRTQSVGTNLPHQEAKVVDPATGSVVPVGTQGELCFRGYHVMKGYYQLEGETREAIDPDGWLHSGDLGVMDEEGYARITGRLKDMVIRGGENIYPAEIETYLRRHPKVAQVAVFGVSDERLGEELGVWVQLEADCTAEAEEFREFVREGMAHYKVPRYVWLVDDFPMTITGKIQKFRMREIVEADLAKQTRQPVGA
jgi:fatty-acyl-CoA synthase